MTAFTQCPGCGHHYGRPMSSPHNENGYCKWCLAEGVHDAASQKRDDDKWKAYHQRRDEEEKERERKWHEDND